MSVFTAMVFKRLYENAGSIFLAKSLDQLDFRVNAVIVVNETADKTDDNDGWVRQNGCRCSGRLRTHLTRDEEQRENQAQDPQRGKHLPHRDRKLQQYR